MHRIDGIHNEVEDHLLQLNPITWYERYIFIQIGVNLDRPSRVLALSEHKDLAYKLVQIDRDTRRRVALEHRADTINDIVDAVTVTNDRLKNCPRFANVGICSFQPAQPGLCICYNGGDRLFDFVRDRSRHGDQLVHARDACKLGSRLDKRVLGLLLLGNVEGYPKRELCSGFTIRNREDIEMYPD